LNFHFKIRSLLSLGWENRQEAHDRRDFEKALTTIDSNPPAKVEGKVLVDATWDNPGFWLRYSLLASGLGLQGNTREAIVIKGSSKRNYRSLRRFGIKSGHVMDLGLGSLSQYIDQAKLLVDGIGKTADVSSIELSSKVPIELLHDFVLKRIRAAFVDWEEESVVEIVAQYLCNISQVESILDKMKPKLVIASHALGYTGPLVWISLIRGIDVVVPYGENEQLRFWRLKKPADIFDFQDCLNFVEFNQIKDTENVPFQSQGQKILMRRLGGEASDIGSKKAYLERTERINRNDICKLWGWDPEKKIIGIYAANWFDYPHTYGMKNFTDFYDWITKTLEILELNTDVNWILKAHPCDNWYGGVTLGDMLSFEKHEHINLALEEWNGASLLRSIDAVITYHGTVGIEATALGKPVMVADSGWYDELGFVKVARDREHFLQLLNEEWWCDMDTKDNVRLAEIFAGAYWGHPTWQGDFRFPDDSSPAEIYKKTPEILGKCKAIINLEINSIGQWYDSGHPHYATYKILNDGSKN